LLKKMGEEGERDKGKGGNRKSQSHHMTVKLADIGITKNQSSRWQAESNVPENVVEEYISEVKGNEEITTAGLMRFHNRKVNNREVFCCIFFLSSFSYLKLIFLFLSPFLITFS